MWWKLSNEYKMRNKTEWSKWRVKWTGNNIGAEGARMISEGLKSNSTLTTLYLSGDEK